jgi:hypothetical protein
MLMVQFSLIPALEAARLPATYSSKASQPASAMSPANRPTEAQVSYLKKLTRIRADTQLARYVVRKLGVDSKSTLTRHDFAKVIDMEVSEKRWAA